MCFFSFKLTQDARYHGLWDMMMDRLRLVYRLKGAIKSLILIRGNLQKTHSNNSDSYKS